MPLRHCLLEALLPLWFISLSVGALAQSVSDMVANVQATVPTPPIAFVAIAPCRLADTRAASGFTGPFGPPSMIAVTPRVFPVAGHCGIPMTAQAVSANLAVTNTSATGFISVWPEGAPQPVPLVASLNYSAGQTIANAVLAPLGTNGGITVYAKVGLDLIIDVNGYFAAGAAAPACLDTSNRYVDCSNGTVTDTVTGLIWLKNANCFSTQSYLTATQAVAGLAAGQCGLTDGSSRGDWRLPTIAEWQATIARALVLGCRNGSPGGPPSLTNDPGTGCLSAGPTSFTGLIWGYYWSSSAHEVFPNSAWDVNLFTGNVQADLKDDDQVYVWPVRGGH